MDKTTCPLNNVKKNKHKFYDMTNYVSKRIYVPKRILITVPKKDVLIVPRFLGQFSLNLRSRLYNCFNKTLPQCNIRVIFQSKNRLSNLF